MVASREKLRDLATDLFQTAVEAAKTDRITCFFKTDSKCFIRGADDYIELDKNVKGLPPLGDGFRFDGYSKDACFHVVAVGKAAVGMAEDAVKELGTERVSSVLVVTHEDYRSTIIKSEDIIRASHPFPDESSVAAGKALIKKFQSVPKGETILLLLSGGGSSLAVAPADGITLQDKIATTQLLFKAGADIKELNCVRKHLSKIKGGQLAQMTKAKIHTITISDVFDDDPASIASGIAYPDETTFQEAYTIMQKYHVWNDLPASVQKRLQDGIDGYIAETPSEKKKFRHVQGVIVASNKQSVEAAQAKVAELSSLFPSLLIGDASDGAKNFVQQVKNGKLHIEVRGGETTVKITGDGMGGRNQHMALAFALQAEEQKLQERYKEWVFLSGGTDGRDGPTEAAGGMVDDESLKRMRKAGIDPQKELDNCNSNAALAASDDLMPRNDTGTNVGDIQIFIGDPHG